MVFLFLLWLWQTEWMERTFCEEEVYEALISCKKDFLEDFFLNGNLFTTRIPPFYSDSKRRGSSNTKYFLPISLVGSVYKVLDKVLARRKYKLIGSLVGNYQHAFLKSRQIMEAPFEGNEVADTF